MKGNNFMTVTFFVGGVFHLNIFLIIWFSAFKIILSLVCVMQLSFSRLFDMFLDF